MGRRVVIAVLALTACRGRETTVDAAPASVADVAARLGPEGRERDARTCATEATAIDAAWDDDDKELVAASFAATAMPYADASARTVSALLDSRVKEWRDVRARICETAEIRESSDATLLERAQWCLDERRSEVEALVDVLSYAEEGHVRQSVAAVAALPPAALCAEAAVLASSPSPPPSETRDRIAEIRTELLSARFLAALGSSEAAITKIEEISDAERIDRPPLAPAAQLIHGRILLGAGRFDKANDVLLAAHAAAEGARAWDVAALAAIELVDLLGVGFERHDEGRRWATDAEAAVKRAGDPLGLLEADRSQRLAALEREAGRLAEAETLLARAVALREKALGPDDPLVAAVLGELADVVVAAGAHDRARASCERALAIHEKLLGAAHPDVADDLVRLAAIDVAIGATADASARLTRALSTYEAALGTERVEVARTLVALGEIAAATSRRADAEAAFSRALTIFETVVGPDHPYVIAPTVGLSRLALARSDPKKAIELAERAVAVGDLASLRTATWVDARLALADVLWGAPKGRGRDRARALLVVKQAEDAAQVDAAGDPATRFPEAERAAARERIAAWQTAHARAR